MGTDDFLSLGTEDIAPTGFIQQVYLHNSNGAFTVNTAFGSLYGILRQNALSTKEYVIHDLADGKMHLSKVFRKIDKIDGI